MYDKVRFLRATQFFFSGKTLNSCTQSHSDNQFVSFWSPYLRIFLGRRAGKSLLFSSQCCCLYCCFLLSAAAIIFAILRAKFTTDKTIEVQQRLMNPHISNDQIIIVNKCDETFILCIIMCTMHYSPLFTTKNEGKLKDNILCSVHIDKFG